MGKIRKILRKVLFSIVETAIFSLGLIIFPVTSLILYYQRFRPKEKTVLFAGLEHIIGKTIVRGEKFIKEGYKVFYYSLELTGNSDTKQKKVIIKSPKFASSEIIFFPLLLRKLKPKYVEIYYTGRLGNGFRQYIYTLFSKISATLNFIVLRGELFYYKEYSFTKKFFIKRALNLCIKILYRETYMLPILQKIVLDNNKYIFDPNKVKVKKDINFKREEKIVLFLNGFKKWRHLDLLIDAIPMVIEKHPEVKFVCVGARNESELQKYKKYASEKKIGDYAEFHIWTDEPQKYYEDASVFVLPADLVYLNFSLLEAMERGVPPIIANVKDAEKIITHESEGFICAQDSEEISKYITMLLDDENLRLRLAKNARNKVVKNFSDTDRIMPILELINNYEIDK